MDAEDVDVWVFGDAFLDVGVEFDGEFFALFGGFGHVHHFGAFGFGHCERILPWCGVEKFLRSSEYSCPSSFWSRNFLIFDRAEGFSGRQDFEIFLAKDPASLHAALNRADLNLLTGLNSAALILYGLKQMESC